MSKNCWFSSNSPLPLLNNDSTCCAVMFLFHIASSSIRQSKHPSSGESKSENIPNPVSMKQPFGVTTAPMQDQLEFVPFAKSTPSLYILTSPPVPRFITIVYMWNNGSSNSKNPSPEFNENSTSLLLNIVNDILFAEPADEPMILIPSLSLSAKFHFIIGITSSVSAILPNQKLIVIAPVSVSTNLFQIHDAFGQKSPAKPSSIIALVARFTSSVSSPPAINPWSALSSINTNVTQSAPSLKSVNLSFSQKSSPPESKTSSKW